MKKVFISSVISDFKECRQAAKRAVEIMGDKPIMSEDFGACSYSPEKACVVKLPVYKAGHQNNIVINDNSICIPLFGKEGLGEILKENFSSPFTKRGIQVHFFIKKTSQRNNR